MLRRSGTGGGVQVIRARKSVVSNASVWDTQKLLPAGVAPQEWAQEVSGTPAIESFMHLHLGIDATGLPDDMQCHHVIVNDWGNLDSTQNVSIVSIPTVFDPSLAPDGKAVVHAYTAANEPWEAWEGVQRGTDAYKTLKHERVQGLWRALERVRAQCEIAVHRCMHACMNLCMHLCSKLQSSAEISAVGAGDPGCEGQNRAGAGGHAAHAPAISQAAQGNRWSSHQCSEVFISSCHHASAWPSWVRGQLPSRDRSACSSRQRHDSCQHFGTCGRPYEASNAA